jgi:hypothetical protein
MVKEYFFLCRESSHLSKQNAVFEGVTDSIFLEIEAS